MNTANEITPQRLSVSTRLNGVISNGIVNLGVLLISEPSLVNHRRLTNTNPILQICVLTSH
jgi:hypothetical protein